MPKKNGSKCRSINVTHVLSIMDLYERNDNATECRQTWMDAPPFGSRSVDTVILINVYTEQFGTSFLKIYSPKVAGVRQKQTITKDFTTFESHEISKHFELTNKLINYL